MAGNLGQAMPSQIAQPDIAMPSSATSPVQPAVQPTAPASPVTATNPLSIQSTNPQQNQPTGGK